MLVVCSSLPLSLFSSPSLFSFPFLLRLVFRSCCIFLWCFFYHSPGVQNLVFCLYDIFMWVSYETAFDTSNNFDGLYDGIITICNFCPFNIIQFEILKGAIISLILKKSRDMWGLVNLTIITNCFQHSKIFYCLFESRFSINSRNYLLLPTQRKLLEPHQQMQRESHPKQVLIILPSADIAKVCWHFCLHFRFFPFYRSFQDLSNRFQISLLRFGALLRGAKSILSHMLW